MARLCPLFSGSSGNSYYIGSQERGVLIDAGKSAKQITEKLACCGIPLSAIKGIFVTHEHSDHVQGLRVFAGRHKIPVYGSFGTMEALNDAQILNGCGAPEWKSCPFTRPTTVRKGMAIW